MKSRKLILILIISTIVSTNFGQLPSIKGPVIYSSNISILNAYHTEVNIFSTSWSNAFENNNTIRNASESRNLDNNSYSENGIIVPLKGSIIAYESTEEVYESYLKVENWMTVPFQYNIIEEELVLESWMCKPFILSKKLKSSSSFICYQEMIIFDKICSLNDLQ